MKEVILKYALQNAFRHGRAERNAVISKLFAEKPELKSKAKDIIKEVDSVIQDVNKLSPSEIENKLKELAPGLMEKKIVKEREGLPDLPNVKGKVVMRFAPFPSGPLHIGNARPAILNDEYVKKYGGKLLLVIDDTIGSEEKTISKDAYKLIPESLEWLKVNFSKPIIYKSDRLEIYYKYAEELIKKDKAYVCSCPHEKLRELRAKGIECKCRSNSIESNLDLWKKMFKAKEGSYILRIKTSMQHKNPAFRDRVIFRIAHREHPKVGKKYTVWPLLEFSWAIDDHLLGITHVLRGKDLMMESEMEKHIWNIFGWPHSEIIHTGLIQIEGIKLSKSKSKKEVETGKFTGWDDPRTASLQSFKRRGFRPEAIRNFCLSFGITQTEIIAPIDILYSENKKFLEKESNRYFFIENPVKIKIKDAPSLEEEIPLHPDYKERGFRKFKTKNEFYIQDKLERGKNYRLMHLFNFKDNKFISKGVDKNLNATLIHWLPVSKDLVNVEVLMPDGSIKKGLGEPPLKSLKADDAIQFVRFGFVRLDKKEGNKLKFWYTHN
ncbi:MAG: glutamate--tRNA ligase [Nanoarchaeota archaeon]